MDFSTSVLAIIPPVLAIGLAVITRQVILSLFAAIFVGAVMISGGNLWEAFYNTFFEYILPQFADTDHQRILALTTFCGGFALLLEKSGGATAFANKMHEGIGKTRAGAQFFTWCASMFIWFSDSTTPVLVGPICRTVTDKAKVSREKLAYMVDATTAAVPCLFPVSAWGAYIIGLISTFYAEYNYSGNPQSDFVSAIPYQYYTIGCVLMVLIIALSGWDYGPMKKAEDRARLTGQLHREGADIRRKVELEKMPEGAKPSIWNMLLPIIVLISFIFIGLFYTGDIKTNGLLGSLANGSSLRALDTAFILASITAMIMGMATKVFNFKKALSIWLEGCTQMMEVLMILMLAWGISSICAAVGTSAWIVSVCESFLTPTSMCAIIFIAACLTSFATGTSWGVFAIFTPIACSLAISCGAPIGMAIGVVLSGGIFGDHCSPISDTTVMSSMGSSCDHIDHVNTQLPYALTTAGSALVGYIICGAMGSPWIGLIVTVALICILSFTFNKFFGRGKDAKMAEQN